MATESHSDTPPGGRWDKDPEGLPGLLRDRRTGTWYVRRRLSLGPGLGSSDKLASLKTKSRAVAVRLYPDAYARLALEIETLRRDPDGSRKGRRKATLADDARYWRERLTAAADSRAAQERVWHELDHTIEELRGEPKAGTDADTGEAVPIYDPEREAKALALHGMVFGSRTPVGFHLDAFLGSRARSVRYDYRIRLAATEFGKWLEGRSEGDAIQAVTKRTAAHFLDHVRQRLADHSLKGWKSGLSLYWDWMMDREEVALNPWKELKPEKRPQVAKPHAFSDAELLALLKGDPGQPLADLIRVGALSGMRLNEIGRLKVKDTEGGWFNVTAAKTSAGVRRVPIHPDLAGIVARRTEGREPETWLFDDLPASAGKGRQRADKAGERFTLYRRSLGVGADHGEGRSPVSFHSLRHWFDTAALNAGTMPVVVSALMGHSEGQSMTRGTYYAGPTAQLMIDAVAAVRLPPAGTSICGSVTA